MRRHRLLVLAAPLCLLASIIGSPPALASTGVGIIPQGRQGDDAYAGSAATNNVTNVFATNEQQVSCYRPEVPYFGSLGPTNGYTGMTECPTGTNTGEDIGASAYPSQVGSNAGFPAAHPMQVKDHSESDIRVDPTNHLHLIGTSKWAVSAEGY